MEACKSWIAEGNRFAQEAKSLKSSQHYVEARALYESSYRSYCLAISSKAITGELEVLVMVTVDLIQHQLGELDAILVKNGAADDTDSDGTASSSSSSFRTVGSVTTSIHEQRGKKSRFSLEAAKVGLSELDEELNVSLSESLSTSGGKFSSHPGNEYEDDVSKWRSHFLNLARRPANSDFSRICGLNDIKSLLATTLLSDPDSRYKHLAPTTQQRRPNILFIGYPGCGKTELVEAYAGLMRNTTLFRITGSDVLSKWIGQSEKMLRTLLDVAEEMAPSIIFIDEVDGLLGGNKDNQHAANFISEFLIRVEELKDVQILAASNYPWNLDSSILRRFHYVLNVPLPKLQTRVSILKKYIGDKACSFSAQELIELAQMCEHFSASDIKRCVEFSQLLPLMAAQRAEFFRKLETEDGEFYQPCDRLCDGVEKLKFTDIPAEKLRIPEFSGVFIRQALKLMKPTVDPDDKDNAYNKKMVDFTRRFGHDLSFNASVLLKEQNASEHAERVGKAKSRCVLS